MALVSIIAREVVLCTGDLDGYAAFTKSRGIKHCVIRRKPGAKTAIAPDQIQNIINLHSRFKVFIKLLRGRASKYRSGYIQWFVARVAGLDASAHPSEESAHQLDTRTTLKAFVPQAVLIATVRRAGRCHLRCRYKQARSAECLAELHALRPAINAQMTRHEIRRPRSSPDAESNSMA